MSAKFLSFKSTSRDDLEFYHSNFSNFSQGRYDAIQVKFGGENTQKQQVILQDLTEP